MEGAKAEIPRWAAAAFYFPIPYGNPQRVPRPCVVALPLHAGRRRALSLLVCTFTFRTYRLDPGGVYIHVLFRPDRGHSKNEPFLSFLAPASSHACGMYAGLFFAPLFPPTRRDNRAMRDGSRRRVQRFVRGASGVVEYVSSTLALRAYARRLRAPGAGSTAGASSDVNGRWRRHVRGAAGHDASRVTGLRMRIGAIFHVACVRMTC